MLVRSLGGRFRSRSNPSSAFDAGALTSGSVTLGFPIVGCRDTVKPVLFREDQAAVFGNPQGIDLSVQIEPEDLLFSDELSSVQGLYAFRVF